MYLIIFKKEALSKEYIKFYLLQNYFNISKLLEFY